MSPQGLFGHQSFYIVVLIRIKLGFHLMLEMAVNDDNFPKGPAIGMNVLTTVSDILCHQL